MINSNRSNTSLIRTNTHQFCYFKNKNESSSVCSVNTNIKKCSIPIPHQTSLIQNFQRIIPKSSGNMTTRNQFIKKKQITDSHRISSQKTNSSLLCNTEDESQFIEMKESHIRARKNKELSKLISNIQIFSLVHSNSRDSFNNDSPDEIEKVRDISFCNEIYFTEYKTPNQRKEDQNFYFVEAYTSIAEESEKRSFLYQKLIDICKSNIEDLGQLCQQQLKKSDISSFCLSYNVGNEKQEQLKESIIFCSIGEEEALPRKLPKSLINKVENPNKEISKKLWTTQIKENDIIEGVGCFLC